MKNMFRAICFALTMVAASASASSFDRCDVVGSYIAIRQIPDVGPVMDHIQLHADGTVWFNQSTSALTPITTGYTSPGIGTWQLKKDIVTLTFIAWDASPITVDECCDVDIANWDRLTQELRVLDKNTLESFERVTTIFPTSADVGTVLTGPGTVLGVGTTPIQFKKVQVVSSDL